MKIGDRVKVKDQDIYGKIIYDHGTEIVIEDENAETDFLKSYECQWSYGKDNHKKL
jgi:hypothetical protein